MTIQKNCFFITGTDTDVGKTIATSWCLLHYNGVYWKPIQSGLEPTTDTKTIQTLTQLDQNDIYPERYRLTQPLSPHESARRDNVTISLDDFSLPQSSKPLFVEGAGGLMVPINDDHFVIDLIKKLNIPVILTARSLLGTINHTLLSIEALRARDIEIAGLIISGPKSPHNRHALEQYSGVPILAEIDQMDCPSREELLSTKPEFHLLES